MPIFEADETITSSEMKRQQRSLNAKIIRLQEKEFLRSLEEDGSPNGDCWLDDSLEDHEDGVH